MLVPPYEKEITGALKPGENELTVYVATTALRDANTRPGIFGTGSRKAEPEIIQKGGNVMDGGSSTGTSAGRSKPHIRPVCAFPVKR